MSPLHGKRLVGPPLVVGSALLALTGGYLLALLAAAAAGRRRAPPSEVRGQTSFVVLIPAHDEESVIGGAIASIRAVDYPAERVEAVVVADNCTDETAGVARAAGVTVWERDDPDNRGKGQALAWALERIWEELPHTDAVAVLDADCAASPNLLAAFDRRFAAGAAAVQADYVVANADESPAAALRHAAFLLANTIRPLGKSVLNLSAGLLGTGMALRSDLLRRVPWQAYGLVEDLEQHLRLVEAGERVVFAPEASVVSPMPASFAAAREQQARWESGKWQTARAWTPRLLRDGIRRRDLVRVHSALELLVPPQSLLAASSLAALAAGILLRVLPASRLAAVALSAQGAFVLGGLRLAGAPRETYIALFAAPRLIAMKVGLYARLAAGRGPRRWIRTDRG